MLLRTIDWAIIGTFGFTLLIGLVVSRRAGRSQSDFFLSGRGMPWWLLGTSMVATTFAADTPLLVTSIVREQGVGGNWVWWAFLLTGMLTVAVFAKLWRRSGILTDVEFTNTAMAASLPHFSEDSGPSTSAWSSTSWSWPTSPWRRSRSPR